VQGSEGRPQLPRVTTGTGAGGLAAAAGSSTSSPVQRKARAAVRTRGRRLCCVWIIQLTRLPVKGITRLAHSAHAHSVTWLLSTGQQALRPALCLRAQPGGLLLARAVLAVLLKEVYCGVRECIAFCKSTDSSNLQ
jgi:hypothetical protein